MIFSDFSKVRQLFLFKEAIFDPKCETKKFDIALNFHYAFMLFLWREIQFLCQRSEIFDVVSMEKKFANIDFFFSSLQTQFFGNFDFLFWYH